MKDNKNYRIMLPATQFTPKGYYYEIPFNITNDDDEHFTPYKSKAHYYPLDQAFNVMHKYVNSIVIDEHENEIIEGYFIVASGYKDKDDKYSKHLSTDMVNYTHDKQDIIIFTTRWEANHHARDNDSVRMFDEMQEWFNIDSIHNYTPYWGREEESHE